MATSRVQEEPSRPPVHVHVPTPGDHYSPATGSAIMTIIYGMAGAHAKAGGESIILVSRGTRHDYNIGECREVEPTGPPRKWQKAFDLARSRLGGHRAYARAAYSPFAEAIRADFEDYVFIHNGPECLAKMRSRAPRAQLILWLHNPVFQHYSRREAEHIEGLSDRIICVSGAMARSVEGRLQRKSMKIRVVHNGVDIHYFRPVVKPAHADGCVILFVGRILPIKGVHLLVQAALALKKRGLKFTIKIVGSSNFDPRGPLTKYERYLRKLASPLGNLVNFRPFVDRQELLKEYLGADIFCAPSNWDEPFGLAIAEAMACGLPVVASRRGGIPEFAGDSVHYFAPPDVNELAERLDTLIRDAAAREDLGARARASARQLDWSCSYRALGAALEE